MSEQPRYHVPLQAVERQVDNTSPVLTDDSIKSVMATTLEITLSILLPGMAIYWLLHVR